MAADLVRSKVDVIIASGIESLAPEIDAKRVELLKAIVPGLKRVAALYSPNDQGAPTHFKYTEDAARALGVRVLPLEVERPLTTTAYSRRSPPNRSTAW